MLKGVSAGAVGFCSCMDARGLVESEIMAVAHRSTMKHSPTPR
jgi:hypothetical protein